MTSQLNVDTIVDKAGSGGTNIKVGNTATYVAEGGSANSNNVVQGLAKCWHDASNAAVLEDSLNISSAVDNGTGNYQFNINNNMNAANYAIPNTTSVAEISEIDAGDQATGRYDIQVFSRNDSFSNADNITQAVVHGDLA